MGGTSNSKPQDLVITNLYKFESVQKLIDSFQGNQIDFRLFTEFLFNKFDQNPHPTIGRMIVSNTFIIQQLFLVLTNRKKQEKLKTSKLKSQFQKIYKFNDKAIEYSFRLFDLDDDKKINKAQFLSFMDNCLTSLLFAAQKRIQDQQFGRNFKSWVKTNKKIFAEYIIKIFDQNAKSNPQYWLLGDFTRWVKDKKHWSLDLQIGAIKLRTPVNLLCLFGIQN